MEENPRFPNRKRKNWDEPDLGNKLPDTELEEFNRESSELEPRPAIGYRIIGSDGEIVSDQSTEAELPVRSGGSAEAAEPGLIDLSAEAAEQNPAAQPLISPPSDANKPSGPIQKLAKSPTRLYALAGVGLGVLLVAVFAVVDLLMAPPNGRYDLGTVTSSATGLEGHLFIQWDKKLGYRLNLKPSDPDQQAAFAMVATAPLRPLSIEIHLLNSEGFVLCSKEVLLKFDPRNAAALAGSAPDSPAGKVSPQGVDPAQLQAQETAREQGKDLFQNQIGPDGQIVAINSQGDLPCSAEFYEKTANWSFSPNFPSLAEQKDWLNRQEEMEANAGRPAGEKSGAHARRVSSKAPARILPFSMEGDDAIVEFNLSPGIIQTRGRKTFLMDKATAAAADPAWQDYPVMIHYRCDQSASCLLMHSGGGTLRARLGN